MRRVDVTEKTISARTTTDGSVNTSADDGRLLTESDCAAIASRVDKFRAGGGESGVHIQTSWRGITRYARNQIRISTDVLRNDVAITRDIDGASTTTTGNQVDDLSLLARVREAEHFLRLHRQNGGVVFQEHFDGTASHRERLTDSLRTGWQLTRQTPEPYDHPTLFFEATYNMDSGRRASAIAGLVANASTAGMLAAGDLDLTARGVAVMDTWGRSMYYPSVEARYTVTVRSPDGSGSGWAGVMWNDWTRVNAQQLASIALDKCLRARNPVRVEPGRYTTILEPQAVHQLLYPVLRFHAGPTGDKVMDERITIQQDPMDPDCGFVPFDTEGNVYHAATWIERGRCKDIERTRSDAIRKFGQNTGLLFSGAYRVKVEGAPVSLEHMIASTKRGIYVTHFARTDIAQGYTRDGTWFIENGVITKAVKNFRFSANDQAVFNNVEAIGTPQRVYTPEFPGGIPIYHLPEDYAALVPPMKVRDFPFIALTDAI